MNGEIEPQRGRVQDPEPHSQACQPTSPTPTETHRHTQTHVCAHTHTETQTFSSLCLPPCCGRCAVHTPQAGARCWCPLTSSLPGARGCHGRACRWTNSGDGALLSAPEAVTSEFTRFQSHLLGREPRFLTQPLGLPRACGARAAPPAGRAAIWPHSRTPVSFTPWASAPQLSGDLPALCCRIEMTREGRPSCRDDL